MIVNQEQHLNIQELQKMNAYIPINPLALQDARLQLIPVLINNKIGFINHNAEIIINPLFDEIKGEFLTQESTLCVSQQKKWGVIDINGNIIISIKYKYIIPGIGCKLYTVEKDYSKAILDVKENTVVDYGIFRWIDGFDCGLARVLNKEEKWGLIDIKGNQVLPTEYDELWNFYGKNRESTYARIGSKVSQIYFKDLFHNGKEDRYDNGYSNNSYHETFSSLTHNPYYNDCLDMDQQSPEFWDSF